MIGDQYGNTVDGEIRVPVRGWAPLGKNSWIEKPDALDKDMGDDLNAAEWAPQRFLLGMDVVTTYGAKDGSQKPLKTSKEWAIAHADGTVDHIRYEMETEARYELELIRTQLKMYRIPEEYWPVLMERTVETVASSWKILDV